MSAVGCATFQSATTLKCGWLAGLIGSESSMATAGIQDRHKGASPSAASNRARPGDVSVGPYCHMFRWESAEVETWAPTAARTCPAVGRA